MKQSNFTVLPIPVDERVPEGFSLILAYAKDNEVVIPIDTIELPEELHNCDWEGCATFSHVVRFNIEHKYSLESQLTNIEHKLASIRKSVESLKQDTPNCPNLCLEWNSAVDAVLKIIDTGTNV